MGADLCMCWLVVDKNRKLNWKAGHKIIDSLKKDEAYLVEAGSGLKHSIEALHADLNYLMEAWASGTREAATIEAAHLNIIVTGGMTWGDDPTELYTCITRLDDVDVSILRSVGFHREEDDIDYKSIMMKVVKNRKLAPLLIGLDKKLDTFLAEKFKGG